MVPAPTNAPAASLRTVAHELAYAGAPDVKRVWQGDDMELLAAMPEWLVWCAAGAAGATALAALANIPTPHSNWTRAETSPAHALRLWRTRFRVVDKKIGTGVKRMPQSKQDGQRKSRIGDGAAAKQRQLESFSQGPENLITTNEGVVIPDN